MIADKLSALGIPAVYVKGLLVLTFGLLSGLIVALAPGWPGDAAVVAFLSGLAVLIDPNVAHGVSAAPPNG